MRRAVCCFDLRAGCWLVCCQYRKSFYLQIKRHTNITLTVLIKMQLFFPSSLPILGFSKSHSSFFISKTPTIHSLGDMTYTRQHWLESCFEDLAPLSPEHHRHACFGLQDADVSLRSTTQGILSRREKTKTRNGEF
jgi:hypothetical protein